MISRMKGVLVSSLVGAIGLGLLLADIVMHFAGIFAVPVTRWLTRIEYPSNAVVAGIWWKDAIPELIRVGVMLLVWYVLFYWLYLRSATSRQDRTPDVLAEQRTDAPNEPK